MRRAAAALAVLALAATGCGGDDGGAPAAGTTTSASRGTPVTDEQTLVLARLLERNFRGRGTRFSGQIPVRGTQVPVRGRVDFGTGRGEFTASEAGAEPRRYVWTRQAVFAQDAPGSARYTREVPAPKTDPVHSAIAFVNLLSAETVDNTTNIRDQDARFLRRDQVGGRPVDVYTLGAGGVTTYWVDRAGGELLQVQATLGRGRVLLRLTGRGAQRVALPRTG